jgi:hypothetical protein
MGTEETRLTLIEKRRKATDDWATFCAQPVPVGDNVRPIRAAIS